MVTAPRIHRRRPFPHPHKLHNVQNGCPNVRRILYPLRWLPYAPPPMPISTHPRTHQYGGPDVSGCHFIYATGQQSFQSASHVFSLNPNVRYHECFDCLPGVGGGGCRRHLTVSAVKWG